MSDKTTPPEVDVPCKHPDDCRCRPACPSCSCSSIEVSTFEHRAGMMQNPEYTGHPIRFELDTESGNNWTLNPVLTGQ